MNEIQISFYTLENLFNEGLWLKFFSELEKFLNVELSHLDTNDPIRRKVVSLDDAATYVCSIGGQEESRMIFGKFGKSKIGIEISLCRDVSFFPNSVSLYFPEKIIDTDKGRVLLNDVFMEGNRCFKPFYSLCDSMSMITRKKKTSGFSVDLRTELIGVFWLTYFSKCYVEFFGQSKIDGLVCEKTVLPEGLAIKIGESPFLVFLTREEAEIQLGKESFVQPELAFEKPIGKNALSFNQIKRTAQ